MLAVRGLTTDFEKHLDRGSMSGRMFGFARRLGQVGYIARGLVIALVGVLVIKAALDHATGQGAGSRRGSQERRERSVRAVPARPAAAGLICFGAYCFVEARYRRL